MRDFTAWSSLTVADARAGLAHVGDELERIERDGTTWYADPDPPSGDAAGAFLIPMYDELTIGYRELRVVLAGPSEGRLERPVVIDGRTVGSWRRTLGPREVVLEVTLFAPLDAAQSAALAAAAERFGRFLGAAGDAAGLTRAGRR